MNKNCGTSYRHKRQLTGRTVQHWALACSGLQLARQLDSQADIGRFIVKEVVDSVVGSEVWSERASNSRLLD